MRKDDVHFSLQQGDCLPILQKISSESIHLIYLDPPFLTQKQHRLWDQSRKKEFVFDDRWISQNAYIDFLYRRLQEMHRILSPDGSLFFHCNKTTSHLARILLNQVFGEKFFRSEIIWYYRRWSNSERALLPAHQTIYYYTKSKDYIFNLQYKEYSLATNVDQILQKRERDRYGKTRYKRDSSGEIISNGAKKGVPLRDVWDIPYLNPRAKERTGYPTQKPIRLLKQIIELSTHPHHRVLDPFCGSGTTLVAAKLLNRYAMGIDISEDAILLTEKRLQDPQETDSALLQTGRENYRQTKNMILSLFQGLEIVPVQRNQGIDAFLCENSKEAPIPIRVQRSKEKLSEAVDKLFRATRNKKIQRMFLIAYTEENISLPPGMVLIPSPVLAIRKQFIT